MLDMKTEFVEFLYEIESFWFSDTQIAKKIGKNWISWIRGRLNEKKYTFFYCINRSETTSL